MKTLAIIMACLMSAVCFANTENNADYNEWGEYVVIHEHAPTVDDAAELLNFGE